MERKCCQLLVRHHVSILSLGVDEGLFRPRVIYVANFLKHPFLKGSWRKEKLQGLVSFVTLWKRPEYEYLGWETPQDL